MKILLSLCLNIAAVGFMSYTAVSIYNERPKLPENRQSFKSKGIIADALKLQTSGRIDAPLLKALIHHESGWNKDAKGDCIGRNKLTCSYGLTQVRGYTAKSYGITTDELGENPITQIELAVIILDSCITRELGNIKRALSCYNQGPEIKYSNAAKRYAANILNLRKRYN